MFANRRDVLKGIGVLTVATVPTTGPVLADEDEETAGLRVAHASPDAPNVDVYVDGAKAVSDLAFETVTEYLEVPTGEREVAVTVVGEPDQTVFGPAELELEAEDYTAVARGEVSSDDTAFGVDIYEDTNGANIDDDETRIRAIHASPDAPAVNVTVNDGALTVFEDLEYSSSSGYTVVPAGDYEFEIRAASGGDPVFEVTAPISGGSTYTVFAVGYLSPDDEPGDEPPAFTLLLVEDASAPPRGDGEEEEEEDDEEEEEEDDEEEEEEEPGRGRGRPRGDD